MHHQYLVLTRILLFSLQLTDFPKPTYKKVLRIMYVITRRLLQAFLLSRSVFLQAPRQPRQSHSGVLQ